MTTDSGPLSVNPGDFGRRITARRQELGLSEEGLAERTGMAPSYVRHLETDPTALPDQRALYKLAHALEVSTSYLLGTVGHHQEKGPGSPDARLRHMNVEECWDHLRPGGLGHVVFDSDRGPSALPVNFGVSERHLVFTTEPGSPVDALVDEDSVGFEVDSFDDAFRSGWSVLATGSAHHPVGEEKERVQALGVESWVPGRTAVLVLVPAEVTGRILEHG